MKRRLIVVATAILLAVALVAGNGAHSAQAASKAPKAPLAGCTYTAWYRTAGPYSSGYNYGSFNISLWELKDIYSGQFCNYLHTSMNYSTPSGHCNSFATAITNNNGALYGIKGTSTFCNGASGSIQSSFVHLPGCNYWAATGWEDNYPDGQQDAGGFYLC